MPQHILRDGKMYVEYSATELDIIRQQITEDLAIKSGKTKPCVSVFEQSHSTNPSRKAFKGNLG